MGMQLFIDETKAKGYVVVAAVCPDASLAVARREIGKLVLPGQRSIHMKHESARRRGHIADAICRLSAVGVHVIVLDAGRGPEPEVVRRARALRTIVSRAAQEASASLVLDLDETLLARDARTLSAAVRASGATSVTYSHQPLRSQPLLSIPDVVAWCWARGGDWRRRVAPIVSEVIEV
ncbi:MAG: hypothetical protein FWD95_11335 [Nocardioidaceae bacterium]|nr:hypothetical protein [Nocardioidaceae bacterium]